MRRGARGVNFARKTSCIVTRSFLPGNGGMLPLSFRAPDWWRSLRILIVPGNVFSLSSHPKQARPLRSSLTRSGREGSWGGRLEIGVKRKDTDGSSDRFHRSAPPVAVPDIFLGAKAPSSAIDRCHSLRSLYPPPAALPSLPPSRFFAYFLAETRK